MRRPVRALAALLLGCLLLELGMRAAGWVYLRVNQRDGLAGGQGQVLICMGDSHVFGLYEEPEDAWPAQLQGLLDAHAEDPWRVANLGFPGASSAHVAERLDSELAAYAPRAVVIYAGDNDIAAGKDAERVVDDFDRFTAIVRQGASGAPILFVAIKPSRLRFEQWPTMADANAAIAKRCAEDPLLHYVDIATPMLAQADPGEPPPRELFLLDGLHLSDAGYAIWTDAVRAALELALGAPAPG